MDNPKWVGDLSEDMLIEQFFAPIAENLSDDVGTFTPPEGHEVLVSTDALQEGIHFVRQSPAKLIAQKALRSNVSDILASGGRPSWFTLSLSLPRDLELRWLAQFAEGLKEAMEDCEVVLLGGDTTAATETISICITVMGHVEKGIRVTRSGARPGDWIGVTGYLGSSAIGLEVVLGQHEKLEPLESCFWLEQHFCPPFYGQLARGLAAQGLVNAMMDLSDGLLMDLPRLCRASKCGALIELDQIPISPEAEKMGYGPRDAVRGGEDYELLFTTNSANWREIEKLAEQAGQRVQHIGTIINQREIVWHSGGEKVALDLPSWKHFA